MVIIQSVRSAIGVFDLEDLKEENLIKVWITFNGKKKYIINEYVGEKAEVEPRTVLAKDGRKGVVHGPSELIMLIVAKNFEESHLI